MTLFVDLVYGKNWRPPAFRSIFFLTNERESF